MELLDGMGRELVWGLLASSSDWSRRLPCSQPSRPGRAGRNSGWSRFSSNSKHSNLPRPPGSMRRFRASWIARIRPAQALSSPCAGRGSGGRARAWFPIRSGGPGSGGRPGPLGLKADARDLTVAGESGGRPRVSTADQNGRARRHDRPGSDASRPLICRPRSN